MDTLTMLRSARDCDLTGLQKSVLWSLILRCGDGGKCWPSIETIMLDSGVRRKETIIAIIKQLEKTGVLTVERKNGASNVYSISLKNVPPTPPKNVPPPVRKTVPPPVRKTVPPPVRFSVPPPVRFSVPEEPIEEQEERERACEQKRVGKKIRAEIPDLLSSVPGFADAWNGFLESRGRRDSAPTERAKGLILDKLAKRPGDAVAALDLCTERSWRGFEWPWFDRMRKVSDPVQAAYDAETARQRARGGLPLCESRRPETGPSAETLARDLCSASRQSDRDRKGFLIERLRAQAEAERIPWSGVVARARKMDSVMSEPTAGDAE